MVRAEGYILRIARKEWVERVFDSAIYYTGAAKEMADRANSTYLWGKQSSATPS
jgi:hypothetical protein